MSPASYQTAPPRVAWPSCAILESGKRDSNPRPQPWQGCALPTELFPQETQTARRLDVQTSRNSNLDAKEANRPIQPLPSRPSTTRRLDVQTSRLAVYPSSQWRRGGSNP